MRFYRRPAPRVALSPNLATGREVSGLPRSWRRVWVWGEGRRRGHPSSIGDARQKEIVGGRGKNCWNCSKGCFAMAKVIRRVFSRDLMGIPRCKFRLLKNLAVNLTKLGKFLLARLKYYTFYLCTLSVSPTNDQFSWSKNGVSVKKLSPLVSAFTYTNLRH